MKYTVKRSDVQFLTDWVDGWKIDGEYPSDLDYRQLTSDIKTKIKQALLEDQGFICCYTGHEIDGENSHIEHIKPQSMCRDEGKPLETLNYTNMLAAYPRSPRGYLNEKGVKYGALIRGNIILNITPLMPDCEQRFKFLADGTMEAATPEDDDAVHTIESLGLKNSRLVDIRKEIIDEIFTLLRSAANDTSGLVMSIELLVNNAYRKNSEGKLRPFCFVIHGVATDTLNRINGLIPGGN